MDTTFDLDTAASKASIEAALIATKVATAAALEATKTAADVAIKTQGRLSYQSVFHLVVWLVTILLAYGVVNTRLSVLESRYDAMNQMILEMHADIKELLTRQTPDRYRGQQP